MVVEGGYGYCVTSDLSTAGLLVDLTRSRELLPDASTYGERQASSARLPGALLSALRFTL
jgi:hypothetical protein